MNETIYVHDVPRQSTYNPDTMEYDLPNGIHLFGDSSIEDRSEVDPAQGRITLSGSRVSGRAVVKVATSERSNLTDSVVSADAVVESSQLMDSTVTGRSMVRGAAVTRSTVSGISFIATASGGSIVDSTLRSCIVLPWHNREHYIIRNVNAARAVLIGGDVQRPEHLRVAYHPAAGLVGTIYRYDIDSWVGTRTVFKGEAIAELSLYEAASGAYAPRSMDDLLRCQPLRSGLGWNHLGTIVQDGEPALGWGGRGNPFRDVINEYNRRAS